MKVFLYTFSKQYNRDLSVDMIPLGIEVIELDSRELFFENLRKHSDVVSLVTEYPDIELHHEIRTIRPDIRVTLIVHQNIKPSDLIKLSHFGIHHILNYVENSTTMAEEILKSILTDQLRVREKRLHVRVQPKSLDKIQGAIFIREVKKFFKGIIIDISAGGFAIRLSDSLEASSLVVGHTYEPVLLSIIGNEIKTMSTLVVKRNDIAGFKFDNVEAKYMKRISEYIYMRLKGY